MVNEGQVRRAKDSSIFIEDRRKLGMVVLNRSSLEESKSSGDPSFSLVELQHFLLAGRLLGKKEVFLLLT